MQEETATVESAAGRELSAGERAYAFVRDGILRGMFKVGGFVEEEQVSSAIGVSRTPVREAFHRLAAEHWLALVPRRGAMVRQVTARELVDVYEVRRVIEGYAIRELCGAKRGVPAESAALLAAMCAEGAESVEQQVRLDQQFHRSLVATLRNGVMVEMYDGLRARQQLVALSAFGADPSRLTTILEEHRALLEAVSRHDAAAAEAVLLVHLQPLAEIVARLS